MKEAYSLDDFSRQNTIHNGFLRKQIGGKLKKWRRYFFILHMGNLAWYKKSKDMKASMKVKAKIALDSIKKIERDEMNEFVFDIKTTDKKRFVLKGESVEEVDLWIEKVSIGMANFRTLARDKFMLSADCDQNSTRHMKLSVKRVKNRVCASDFERISVIGDGSFSKVYLVRKRDTGENFALKVINKQHIREVNHIKHTLDELSILKTIDHPFIMKLYFAFQTQENLQLVLEFVNGGDLYFHIKSSRYFSEDRTRFYAAEILLALEFLHSKNILYRDLKPENILLNSGGHIVLTDFGLSKILSEDTTASFCGTVEFMSPEIILSEDYSFEVDYWAFGLVIYIMLTGFHPFRGEHERDLYTNILRNTIRYPTRLSDESMNLIHHLTNKDPQRRLQEPEVIKTHPFFSLIDWDRIECLEIEPPFVLDIKDSTDGRYIDREYLDMTMSSGESLAGDDETFNDYSYYKT